MQIDTSAHLFESDLTNKQITKYALFKKCGF